MMTYTLDNMIEKNNWVFRENPLLSSDHMNVRNNKFFYEYAFIIVASSNIE